MYRIETISNLDFKQIDNFIDSKISDIHHKIILSGLQQQ